MEYIQSPNYNPGRSGKLLDFFVPRSSTFEILYSYVFIDVLALCRKFKVFYSVVVHDAVDMVDYLPRMKIPTERFFHYQPVFKNITLFIAKWVLPIFDINVSPAVFCPATLPAKIVRTILGTLRKKIVIAFATKCRLLGYWIEAFGTSFHNLILSGLHSNVKEVYGY